MKFVHIIKKVNNTELGKGGTHETYVLVPQELDVSDFFEELERKYQFVDKSTNKVHELRLTSGREKRIVGLGPFYREHNVCAGDEMLFEKRVDDSGSCDFFVSVKQFANTVVFQKKKRGFAVLTPDRLDIMLNKELSDVDGGDFSIIYLGEFKMREDSPELTKIYDIIFNESHLSSKYTNNQMLELVCNNGIVEIRPFCPWKKYVIGVNN